MTMVRWLKNQEEHFKGIQMIGIQRWNTATQSFTTNSLTIEEKGHVLDFVSGGSKGDIATKYRIRCNSLKADQEQFEQIYERLKSQDNGVSVSMKEYIAQGWNHPYHMERLLKYRERYFKDVQELSEKMSGDHFTAFYEFLAPIDDDLEDLIVRYKQLKFPPGMQKHSIDILKMIDQLKRRSRAYKLYE